MTVPWPSLELCSLKDEVDNNLEDQTLNKTQASKNQIPATWLIARRSVGEV